MRIWFALQRYEINTIKNNDYQAIVISIHQIIQLVQIELILLMKIEFISATNKLKLFKNVIQNQTHNNELENVIETEKKLYKMRKDAGKKVCRSLLMFYQSLHIWITDYDKHKKRDDLADCFLQGYYYTHLKYNQSGGFDLDTFLQNYSSYQ